jgi:hypothetical protein
MALYHAEETIHVVSLRRGGVGHHKLKKFNKINIPNFQKIYTLRVGVHLERACIIRTRIFMDILKGPVIMYILRITGFLKFAHRPEFQATRKHNVLETASASVFG